MSGRCGYVFGGKNRVFEKEEFSVAGGTFGAAGRFAAGSVQVGGGGIRARHRKPCADLSSVRCFGGFYGEGRLRNGGN